ncbi:MAG: hypothetical protein ACI31G_04185 [Bacilli bacterium]
MSGFFKSFGRGVLYVIFLPFIVLLLALYSVVGVFILLYLSIKSVILFFKAKTIFSPLEEDIEADLILHKSKDIHQKIIAAKTGGQTVNETNTTTNNIIIVSEEKFKNMTAKDVIDQVENNRLPLENNSVEQIPFIDKKEEDENIIHISRNPSKTSKQIEVNNEEIINEDEIEEEEEYNFLEEPIPHEDEIYQEENKPVNKTTLDQVSNKSHFYTPKGTSVNEDDYDFSMDDEDEEETTSGVTFDSYRGKDDD